MKFLVTLLPLLFIGIVMFAPQQAFAQNASFFGPIISPACECKGSAPDWGCVLATVQNLINFMVSLGFIIFVFAIAYAGLTFMASPVNAHAREMGRTVMLNSVIGLAIVLSSWLLIDFVMKILYKPDTQVNGAAIGPWNSILAGGEEDYCLQKRNPPTGIVDAVTGNVGTPTGDTDAATERLVARINGFQAAASSAGLSAVYEVSGTAERDRLKAAGVNGSVISVPGVAAHFSVYGPGGSGGQASAADRSNASCPNAVTITHVPTKNNSQIDRSFYERLVRIPANDAGIGAWRVTEAFPPTSTHQSKCHYTRTCVDANFTN